MKPEIFLTTLGSAGDLNPKIALGREMQRRGYPVTVASHTYHRRRIELAGLPFEPIDQAGDYESHMRNPDLWHPLRGFALLAKVGIPALLRPVYDRIAARDPAQTIVVSSGLIMAASIASEKLGVPHVSVHLQPSVIQSLDATPAIAPPLTDNRLPRMLRRLSLAYINRFGIDRLLAPSVNAFRAELGLPPARNFFGEAFHSPRLTLALWPDWYGPKQPDWPASIETTGFVRYDAPGEHEPPEGLDSFLETGSPPIVFTPGTAMQLGERFFATAVAASQRLGRRAILLTPHREQLPRALPEGIAHFDYIPFSQVLPRAAALVYHGGIGTLAQALAAGIPQLVMPMAHDQPDNARRVERLGVGDWISPSGFRPPAVSRRLEALLASPEVARRCAELAPRVDFEAGLARACDRLEAVAR